MKRVLLSLLILTGFLVLAGTVESSQERFSRWEPVFEQPVVLDRETGIVWQGCSAGLRGVDCSIGNVEEKSLQEAITYCEGLNWGGYTDWHLPSVKELDSILDLSRVSPAIDPDVFPGATGNVWSSTQVPCYPDIALVVDIVSGSISWRGSVELHEVRCSRKGT